MDRPATLGPSAEAAWSHLRRHAEWSKGFWVAWLFSVHRAVIRGFEHRMDEWLRASGRSQIVLRARTPDEVRHMLELVMEAAFARPGCLWVEVLGPVAEPSLGGSSDEWREAWSWLMMRANERRTLLEGQIPGGIVFIAPPSFKSGTAGAAPDLWSIRSLVLEPEPPASGADEEDELVDGAELGFRDELSGVHYLPPRDERAPDVELALERADLQAARGDRQGQATALMRAAEGLAAARQWYDAVEKLQQALPLWRHLAAEDPDRFLPGLAQCLRKLGVALSAAAEGDEARRAAEEAVLLHRQLARSRPDVFERDLADSLLGLGRIHGKLELWKEAMEATREAVDIGRKLARERPQEYEPGLVRSLNLLGRAYRDRGQAVEALDTMGEAVARGRALVKVQPEAGKQEADLARILLGLGVIRGMLGEPEEAMAAMREAVAIGRKLVTELPGYESALATSLLHLAYCHLELGQSDEALAAVREAVATYRELSSVQPGVFGEQLALALNHLGVLLGRLGRRVEGLQVTREAVAAYSDLVRQRPAAFRAHLETALHSLQQLLEALGQDPGEDPDVRAARALLASLPAD